MLAAITLWGTLLNLLILAVVIVVAIAVMLYAGIHRLSHAKVQPSSPEEAARQDTLPNRTKAWAEANKFRFLGHYEMGTTRIVAWQHTSRPTLLCQYLTTAGTRYDFISTFADDIWLTTSNTRDGQLFPKPAGKYSQTYPDMNLDELWQRHADMEVYLVQQGGAHPGQIHLPLDQTMNQAMLQQLGHVQSLSLWPLRAVWWYFAAQRQRAGLSIMDQRQLGWIRLPNEAAGGTDEAVKA